jgi:hypothetical protein
MHDVAPQEHNLELDHVMFQSNFDFHLKKACEMTEVGETVARVDTLIKEATVFQKLCMVSSFILLRFIRHMIEYCGAGMRAAVQVSSFRSAVLCEVRRCASQTIKTCWDGITDAELNDVWTDVPCGV